MSGVSGSNRISRTNFDIVLRDYTNKVLKKIPGFEKVEISGSYNSDKTKSDFGDMDLIVYFKTEKNKSDFKKDLAKYFGSLSDSITVPFSSEKYKGKKYYNSGEIVTINYPQPEGTVQIDNIIALDLEELEFKKEFLDLPAEKQGLVLGLIKIALQETEPEILIKRLNIKTPDLEKNEKLEFNLSSVELQLRAIVEEEENGKIKQTKKRVVWNTKDWNKVLLILKDYNIAVSFDDLVLQAQKKVKNKRGLQRIVGVFKSMISVKSGEVGTPKGFNKEQAIKKIESILESVTFKSYLLED